jgi:hypothetical protein
MVNKKTEQYPFEFIFKINNNIICQRFLPIINYNEDVKESLELKELLDRIIGLNNGDYGDVHWGELGLIPKFLKDRSSDYLSFFNNHSYLNYRNREGDEKDDMYTFQILIHGKVVGESQISANIFPPKIRYKVNLKYKTNIWGEKLLGDNGKPIHLKILSLITKDIQNTFSKRTYTKEYMGYSLDYNKVLIGEILEKYSK